MRYENKYYHLVLLRKKFVLTIRGKTVGLRDDVDRRSHFTLNKQEEQKKDKTLVSCRQISGIKE